MSEVLGKIDVNDYGVQSMTVSGSSTEDLSVELGSQDAALSLQETKIDQLEAALDAKIALDLTNATSDANATAGDIAQGKTAYVNGSKLTGTLQPPEPDWSAIGYSSTPQDILDDYNYSKNIADNWDSTETDLTSKFYNNKTLKHMPYVDTSNVTIMNSMFYECTNLATVPLLNTSNVTKVMDMFRNCKNLISVPLLDTSNVTIFNSFFESCENIVEVPQFNTSNATNISTMFNMCHSLTTVPVLNISKVTYMYNPFRQCEALSNDSLNNILAMCIGATSYTGTKTLATLGLSSTQQATCQTLSNWDAFVAAGWSAS